MMREIFCEQFGARVNLFTRIDARIKIMFVITGIVSVLLSPAALPGLIISLLVIAALLKIKVPFKIILLRLTAGLGVGITVLLLKVFFFHQTIWQGIAIISKIIGSTSLVLFLSLTTPMNKLLKACCWLKISQTWIEISLIAYRYIFVLWEDAITVFEAQKLRLGYRNLGCTLRSVGSLSAAIIIRAYDQSIATYEAMLVRGYRGEQEI